MKIPQSPMMAAETFHHALMQAKNKAEVIDILCRRGSQHGWFSDMPEGLFDKLQTWRSPQSKSA